MADLLYYINEFFVSKWTNGSYFNFRKVNEIVNSETFNFIQKLSWTPIEVIIQRKSRMSNKMDKINTIENWATIFWVFRPWFQIYA